MSRFIKKLLAVALLSGAATGCAQAEDASDRLGVFANPKKIFRPLLADPREIQLALRLTTPVSQKNLGDMAAGDYFGLYRWALPWQNSYLQWSIAGGVFARFDLVAVEKTSEVVDFSAHMPVDIRVGQFSTRLLPYHLSSHLGDDFIKKTGQLPNKYSFDSFKHLFAFEPGRGARFYAGYNYVIRNAYVDLGRYALQMGIEWTSPWLNQGHAQIYWASDFQTWQRVKWNPSITTQLGLRLAHDPEAKRAISLFTEYGAGPLAYGQLFRQKESHWVLGLRFENP